MFIGHYAVALAAKKAVPKTSLGTLFLAVQLLDLLWPILLLLGVEHVRIDPGNTVFTPLDLYDYPVSHSLVTVLGWSLAFSIVYYAVKRNARAASLLGACVFSHWVLDYITHRPDMPLSPWSSTHVGLGLWNSFAGTVIVEGALFLGGVLLYARATVATDRTGYYAFWSLIAFFAGSWLANMVSPPPPNETMIAYGALLFWVIVPWGYWIDRHRKAATGQPAP